MPGTYLRRPLASWSSCTGHRQHRGRTHCKTHHKTAADYEWKNRKFAWVTLAKLTPLTCRSIARWNFVIQAMVLDTPRKDCPYVFQKKPTLPSSSRQALRGNDGISRARAESHIAECANARFRPPFFFCTLPPSTRRRTAGKFRGQGRLCSCMRFSCWLVFWRVLWRCGHACWWVRQGCCVSSGSVWSWRWTCRQCRVCWKWM